MLRVEPVAWTDEDRALWARVAAHNFEARDASLTFADRLARDHGWTLSAARATIDEYRRFCFLALRAGHEVTPSEAVDEVWHQHLTYSRDYWQVWCPAVLRRDLHHAPTRGGAAEAKRFASQYAETLAAYEAWFGPPPADVWPGTAERFGPPRFRIVDRTSHLVVPVPRGLLARLRRLARVLGIGALLATVSARSAAAAGSLGVLDWTAGPFLTFYVLAAGASLLAALILSSRPGDDSARRTRRSRLTSAELGYLAGGPARAADVLVLEDIAAGRIAWESRVRQFGILKTQSDVLTVGGQDVKRAWLVADKADEVADLRRLLVEKGLVLSDAHRRTVRLTTMAFTGPVILLGLAKLAVGAERDKPVGILLFLLVATVIAALFLAEARSRASRAGCALLAAHKAEHGRALRAPRSTEVIGAFAVAGAAALAGTEFERYGQLMKAENGGGCGSGCGGGGCGGCGGCGGGD